MQRNEEAKIKSAIMFAAVRERQGGIGVRPIFPGVRSYTSAYATKLHCNFPFRYKKVHYCLQTKVCSVETR